MALYQSKWICPLFQGGSRSGKFDKKEMEKMGVITPFGSTIDSGGARLSLPDGMLFGLILFILCMVLFFRRMQPKKLLLLAVLFVYLGAVFSLTQEIILPGRWDISVDSTWQAISSIERVPFEVSGTLLENSRRVGNYAEFIYLVGGNLILLMPLGILLPLINPRLHFFHMLLIAALTALSLEGFQLVGNILLGYSKRTVEVDDLIFNTGGCLLAYLLFVLCRRIRQKQGS